MRQRLYLSRIDLHGEQEIPGLIHARAGELLVFGDIEVSVESCPNFLVCPTLYGLGHHPGLGVHNQLEFGALFWGDRDVIERHGVGNGHPVAVLLYDVQYPTAERLSYRSPGEHGKKVAAAKGEDAATSINYFWGRAISALCCDFNYLRHVWRKFIGITAIDTRDTIFLSIAKSAGKFGGTNPKSALVLNW